MKNYYKISEFAALCGLSRDTLLHYDHIGILKPALVAPSGYRYYTLSQFTTVDLIAVLKASGTPLSEIRGYLQNADVPTGIRLLEGKVQDLRARRAEIDRMIQSLEQTLEDMREGEQCVCGRLQLVQQPQRYLIATPTGYRRPPTERQLARAIGDNLTLSNLKNLTKGGMIDRKAQQLYAQKQMDSLEIKAPGLYQLVKNLSGGNQQKVVLGRWLGREPDILIFDEPTRGIDVGAKAEIYKLMDRLVRDGKSIIMVSSDMEELLGMSDRLVILHKGRYSGTLSREEFSQETVLQYSSGGEMNEK